MRKEKVSFTIDKDLMSWFKAEKPDLTKHLCEFPISEGREPNLEQFWLFIATEEDMDAGLDKLTQDEVSEILEDCESEQEAKDRIKNYIVSTTASGFVQWHKHPKRMSQYGKDTLVRLTSDGGLFTLLGIAEQVHTDQADYNTWGLRISSKTA